MASATPGVLVTSDEPTIVYLQVLNEQLLPPQKFLVRTLDSTHVFVKADKLPLINEWLHKRLAQTIWSEEDEQAAVAALNAK